MARKRRICVVHQDEIVVYVLDQRDPGNHEKYYRTRRDAWRQVNRDNQEQSLCRPHRHECSRDASGQLQKSTREEIYEILRAEYDYEYMISYIC